jgi:DNA-binding transcriptional LysR family regulator
VRSSDFVLKPSEPVPLISSPNWLVPDRRATEALERAKRQYEIVFSAFDGASRISAVSAAVGCMLMPRSHVPSCLVIEDSGVLPAVSPLTAGIITREDLDAGELRAIIVALRGIFCRKTISEGTLRTGSL